MKNLVVNALFTALCSILSFAYALNPPVEAAGEAINDAPSANAMPGYVVGIDDVLEISVLQPEQLMTSVIVNPAGMINFPYLGSVDVKGLTLDQVSSQIQERLSEGYMKYPVVSVALKENRSKKFFVYGEIIKPGTYPVEDNTTVLRAISIAGGFTKYGSSSRVKILRPRPNDAGYETIKVNLASAMSGNSNADLKVLPDRKSVV